MDMQRLFTMLTRMLFRKAVKTGVRHMTRTGKPKAAMTPEERHEGTSARAMSDRVRQAARIGRKLFR